MRKRNGLTLIELMVVIMIVGVLAAVAIPRIGGRSNAAMWTEGKSALGCIATAMRAYAAVKGAGGNYPPSFEELGFRGGDLDGTHFKLEDYSIPTASFVEGQNPELSYVIQCDKAGLKPNRMTLDQDGTFMEASQ